MSDSYDPEQREAMIGALNTKCELLEQQLAEAKDNIKKMQDHHIAATANWQKGFASLKAENATLTAERDRLRGALDETIDFAKWMTGCGYDFCQHKYFCQQRDKLLKGES